MIRHLVLIGMNFQPRRSSGDKNFWVGLLPLLAERLSTITVLSIRKSNIPSEEIAVGGCQVKIKYLNPKFLETPDASYGRKRIFWKKGSFPRGLGVIEKLLNLRSIFRELDELSRENPFQHIHLMDNLGFANRFIAKRVKSSVSVSAMAYQPRKNVYIYKKFLRICYAEKNLTVVPYSLSYGTKLSEIGIEKSKIHRIPWGINSEYHVNRKNVDSEEPFPHKPFILWTGYIQQIKKDDFLYALEIAEKALESGLRASFFFAFKPESFENGFEKYDSPQKGITVRPTNVSEFNDLKEKADIMFSPLVRRDVILAPPLSWIEMMGAGVPVVTTNVPGAQEAVLDGKTGCIAESDDELITKLFLAVNNYRQFFENCTQHIVKNYNLKDSSEKFLSLWNRLASERS